MSNTIKITKEIPAPPEGWQYEDRKPNPKEECKKFNNGEWDEGVFAFNEEPKPWDGIVFAFRIPKKKRLMTPVELAGKWLHRSNGESWMVVKICLGVMDGMVNDFSSARCACTRMFHEEGVLWSDTPTSEPRSLEVDA